MKNTQTICKKFDIFPILVLILFLTTNIHGFAQVPEKITYQAVIRDNNDKLVTDKTVGIRVSIIQTSATGNLVFAETHTPTTNGNGLVSIEIGGGVTVAGSFSSIDWTMGPYFLKTETDINGGTNFNIGGTRQLLSVPYAFYANTAENYTGNIIENQSLANVLALGNRASHQIKNVTAPTDEQDVATKAYVDAFQQQIDSLKNMLYKNGLMRVKDIDGNSYPILKFGEQEWIVENLRTTKYNDGTPINHVEGNTEWGSQTEGAYCWFKNDEPTYKIPNGAYYNWYAIETDKLCPTGWHVPTKTEWDNLVLYIGQKYNTMSTTGKAMASKNGWYTSTTTGTIGNNPSENNISGFTAIPGGGRTSGFVNDGYNGFYWVATEYTADKGWYVNFFYDGFGAFVSSYSDKFAGKPVRCLKD